MKNNNKSFLTNSQDCIYQDTHEREEVVHAYMQDRLPPKEKQAFEEHFFVCDICFQEVRMQEGLQAVATSSEDIQGKRGELWARLTSLISSIEELFSGRSAALGVAVALLLLMFVLGRVFWGLTNSHQDNAFAENFEPAPFLETLVGQTYRATDLKITSPRDGVNLKEHFFGCGRTDLGFSWQRQDSSRLFITILNNQEEKVESFTTTANRYVFEDAANRLAPGLYYWRLEDEDELKHVGKFYIEKTD